MRILITGATGFIGSHLVKRLLSDGHELTAVVRSPAKLPADIRSQIQLIEGDLSIFKRQDLVLDEVDYVIHLAGVVAGKNEQEYADINYQATADVVDCLNRQSWKPKRLVFSSSLAAMGPNGATRSTENDTPAPVDPYGEAKLKSEELLKQCDFPTTSFRPALVFGPADTATLTLFKIARSGVGVLPAGHVQPLSYIYIDDLVSAMVLMLGEGQTAGHQLYFAAANDDVDSHQMLHRIGAQMGKTVKILGIPVPLLKLASLFTTLATKVLPMKNQLDSKQIKQITASGFVCSAERLQERLGWQPEVGFDEGAKRTIAWYVDNKWM